MATLRAVKKRIRTVVSTKRITSAMEKVAAAKLRRAQQKVEETRPYSRMMNQMLSHLAKGATGEITHPYFEKRTVKKRTLVVFASDRGLCGSFNANVIREASEWLKKIKDAETEGAEIELVTVGKKANDYFKRREWHIAANYTDWEGALSMDRAREMMAMLTDRFVKGETDEVVFLFTRFKSTVSYSVEVEPFLPISKKDIGKDKDQAADEVGINIDYIFEPSPEAIYASLMPSYAMVKMVTALVESFASEHGSRMVAMGNATTNAGEMIENLTLDYNKARQGQITKELLEVVSGAEALRG
jgi:F-type H+-transporting ATPase subunit gamma